ncbi:nuclear transport factor 2 family protein [Candidatus Parcubacteria bacterium]|nr:MAG: nuclear transport factor 2 family protein [Candidatus Parcubacteria bacterium]
MERLNEIVKQDLAQKRITNVETIKTLWTKTYNTEGHPDWSHILPFYAEDIHFRDSIQEIHGIKKFKEMTERLAQRSKDLKMHIVNAVLSGNTAFIEWEMTLSFKKYPSAVLYGCSRLTLNDEGKIQAQRDYYDLWGDIFDNIPRFGKAYRKFMIKKFG